MSNDKLKRLLIVIFLGPLGVHKFMDGKILMGILYLCTGGLFGIGWIVDIVKTAVQPVGANGSSILPYQTLKEIRDGGLPIINGTNLNLMAGETCHYADRAYTFKDKTITTGYTGRNSGVSVRVAKGVTYHTGGSGSQAIRETQRTTYNGALYITNRRIIFTSQRDNFDKTFDKITSVNEVRDGVLIQIGSNAYSIVTPTHREFMMVYNRLR